MPSPSSITFYGGIHEIGGNKFLIEDSGPKAASMNFSERDSSAAYCTEDVWKRDKSFLLERRPDACKERYLERNYD